MCLAESSVYEKLRKGKYPGGSWTVDVKDKRVANRMRVKERSQESLVNPIVPRPV